MDNTTPEKKIHAEVKSPYRAILTVFILIIAFVEVIVYLYFANPNLLLVIPIVSNILLLIPLTVALNNAAQKKETRLYIRDAFFGSILVIALELLLIILMPTGIVFVVLITWLPLVYVIGASITSAFTLWLLNLHRKSGTQKTIK